MYGLTMPQPSLPTTYAGVHVLVNRYFSYDLFVLLLSLYGHMMVAFLKMYGLTIVQLSWFAACASLSFVIDLHS